MIVTVAINVTVAIAFLHIVCGISAITWIRSFYADTDAFKQIIYKFVDTDQVPRAIRICDVLPKLVLAKWAKHVLSSPEKGATGVIDQANHEALDRIRAITSLRGWYVLAQALSFISLSAIIYLDHFKTAWVTGLVVTAGLSVLLMGLMMSASRFAAIKSLQNIGTELIEIRTRVRQA